MNGQQATRILRALVSGEAAMCQAPGCAHVFPPGEGRSNRRFCGRPDCTRNRRVKAEHRRQAIADAKAEIQELPKDGKELGPALEERGAELLRAISEGGDAEDVRVAATRLAAVSLEIAAVMEAHGRAGLSSQPSARPGASSPSNSKGLPPGADKRVARAALEAAS